MERIVAKISGIFIPVTDVRRSAEWYTRMFDMEVIDADDGWAGLAFPQAETFVNLCKVDRPQPVEFDTGSHKLCYFNFETFDVVQSHRRLKEAGAEVSDIHSEIDGIRFFDCFDPDGHPLGIVEELPHSPYYAHKQKYRTNLEV